MSRTAGPAPVRLPPLGFGAATLGNLYAEVDDEHARAVVDAAWECGIRYFDVAPHYGLGLAERRLGLALAVRPRGAYVLSTKVGRILEPSPETAGRHDAGFLVPADLRRVWDASEAGIRRSLAESCARLGVERVDVAFLHDPEEHVAPDASLDAVLAEGLGALARLRTEGVLDAVGVGSKSVDALHAAVRTGLVDVVMVAGRYTLLEQPAAAELLPACLEAGVLVVAASVLNSGALAEDEPRAGLHYEYGSVPPDVLAKVRRLADLARRHGTSLPTAALQFPLRHPAVGTLVLGAESAGQVRQNVERLAEEVPPSFWAELAAGSAAR